MTDCNAIPAKMAKTQNLNSIFSFFVVLTLVSLTFTGISYLASMNEGGRFGFWSFAIASFVRFYLWGALIPLIFRLTRKFNFELKPDYLQNFLIHTFFGFFFSIVHFTGYIILLWLLDSSFRERYHAPLAYFQASSLGSLYLGLIFYALIVFAIQGYLSRLNYLAEEKRASGLQSALVQAQLQALKMQLQPHFLFNTLNSISSLVLTNPQQAHAMIAQLGDFLRLTLDYNEDQMVLLKEELRFLRSYLEIEQIRFSDRLQIDFDIESEVLNAVVPHLVLQPIVENSIKHGIAQLNAGGSIEIRADKLNGKLRLQVKNNSPEIDSQEKDSLEDKKIGTGLSNVQTRLRHLYEEDFSFAMENDEKTTVTIVLPLQFDFAATKTE
jgi:sensor histidine kinase YesM